MKGFCIILILVLVLTGITGCHTAPSYNPIYSKLNGYWIPERIIWKSPQTTIPDIDKNTNVADFGILCFDSLGKCDLIFSSQTKLNSSDSIGVEYEPGMELWKGENKCTDGNCDKIIVKFTPIPDESGRFYNGAKMTTDTIRIIEKKDETYLYFRNKRYLKTTQYDLFSRNKIEALRRLKY